MNGFRYIENTTSLNLVEEKCIGCGRCQVVCPHRLFELVEKKAILRDANTCIECGACAKNCPVEAITVTPGVGCASLIITSWINKFLGREVITGCC